MLGYQNKVLRINLTHQTILKEPLRMDWARKYIGSKGLAIKYLYEELQPGIDPLSEENKLLFMTTPLTGTNIPCSGKLSIAGKSPATRTICDCSIGGHIGLKIKYAGYDAIILEGKMDKPSYIVIENDHVVLLDATEYWGKGAHTVESLLTEHYGYDYSYLTIGPAGETQCGMACINSDYYRQAGRGGMGAVMGSKNIKAIAVKGTTSVK
ncbi:MAG: aldehyde ferredoxin oxidoreductase N-terminal domain-containing protein, partial [Eubacterium sp.]